MTTKCKYCDEGVKWRQDFDSPLCEHCKGTGVVSEQNDLERVTRMAEECGAKIFMGWPSTVAITFSKKQLLAFKQTVLAKQSKSLEFQEAIVAADGVLMNSQAREIESLQAKLAMQAYALSNIRHDQKDEANRYIYTIANDALNATQPTVDTFMAEKKAEWEKGVLEECYQLLCNTASTDWLRDRFQAMIKERGGVR